MFEAIATVCLLGAPETCRDVLVAGHEQADLAACTASLSDLTLTFSDAVSVQDMACKPVGIVGEFTEIADGVFAHLGAIAEPTAQNVGDVSNIGFIIGDTSIVVIDTGGSRQVGETVYRAIRQQSALPISHVILTHMHPDHVLGTSVFAELGARIIGHPKLATALGDRAETYQTNFKDLIGEAPFIGTSVVPPDTSAEQALELDLGGRVLELRSWQTSHTTNDLTVFDQTSGVMFTGDLVFHDHTPALDGSVRGWVAVLDEMTSLPVQKIVPGHGGPVLDWPEGAEALSRYLEVLIRDTKEALARGESLSTAAEKIAIGEAPNWKLFDLFNARNATVAFTELEWE